MKTAGSCSEELSTQSSQHRPAVVSAVDRQRAVVHGFREGVVLQDLCGSALSWKDLAAVNECLQFVSVNQVLSC